MDVIHSTHVMNGGIIKVSDWGGERGHSRTMGEEEGNRGRRRFVVFTRQPAQPESSTGGLISLHSSSLEAALPPSLIYPPPSYSLYTKSGLNQNVSF
jgi:hypothetical protein